MVNSLLSHSIRYLMSALRLLIRLLSICYKITLFSEIKKSLTFVDSNVQINSLIKERFAFEVSRISMA